MAMAEKDRKAFSEKMTHPDRDVPCATCGTHLVLTESPDGASGKIECPRCKVSGTYRGL